MSSTLVARFSQLHQTYLVRNLSNYNLIFQQKIHSLASGFMYLSSNIAIHKADVLLYKLLLVQSRLMAFVDVFELFALLGFVLIPFGFLLKIPKKDEVKR